MCDLPLPRLNALDVWIAIKEVLRRELGDEAWFTWIRDARLVKIGAGNDRTLLIAVPRRGQACFEAMKHVPRLRRHAAKMNYFLGLTIEPTPDQLAKLRDRGTPLTYLEAR